MQHLQPGAALVHPAPAAAAHAPWARGDAARQARAVAGLGRALSRHGGEKRPGAGARRARGRCAEISGAAMARARRRTLHRHRLLGGDARSRLRLDQRRYLSRAGDRPQPRRARHGAGKAWAHSLRKAQGRAQALPCGHRVRRRSARLSHLGHRGAVRHVRVQLHRRDTRFAGGGARGRVHQAAVPGSFRDCAGRLRRAERRAHRGTVRRIPWLLPGQGGHRARAHRAARLLPLDPDLDRGLAHRPRLPVALGHRLVLVQPRLRRPEPPRTTAGAAPVPALRHVLEARRV